MKHYGIKVGNGLGLGKVVLLNNLIPQNLPKKITETNVEKEIKKAFDALSKAIFDYEKIEAETTYADMKELAKFYKMLLSSNKLKADIEKAIKNDLRTATYAIKSILQIEQEKLAASTNVYMQERSNDIKDVSDKLLRKILNIKEVELEQYTEDIILVSKEITPSVLLTKHIDRVKGIISEIGGKTSHVAILASNLGIPSVFGIKNVKNIFKENELILVNGNRGYAVTNLTEEDIKQINDYIIKDKKLAESLKIMNDKTAVTLDGKTFEVAMNAGDISDLNLMSNLNSDGIGLFRSEFLYLNRTIEPSEDYLFNIYKAFAEKMGEKPYIIRTLDIGGDKKSSYINIGEEENPFLGYRAIRYCLKNEEFFKVSLRAILRASNYGNVMIMYPMISSLEEIRKANKLLEEAKAELDVRNEKYKKNIKVGIMVEIPSIAEIADLVIDEVDFFSIGTNDLIQYSIAVDRGNSNVNDLYTFFHPGVIRLIKKTIDASNNLPERFTGMCGEMAADPLAIILLVGLGLNEFSVNISSVLKTKKLISLLNYEECKKIAEEVLQMKTASEIENKLNNYAKELFKEYY